jgi:hypothetical protein
MRNDKALAMLESRFSDQIKLFNHYAVSDDDSDTHYWAVKDRIELAKNALERAPEIKVTTLARSLGDVYIAVRKNLLPEEREKWESLAELLETLSDKYM